MITQRDLNLWPERQKSARDSEQEAGALSLELRKRSNDLQKKTYTKWINSFLNEVPIDFNMPLSGADPGYFEGGVRCVGLRSTPAREFFFH